MLKVVATRGDVMRCVCICRLSRFFWRRFCVVFNVLNDWICFISVCRKGNWVMEIKFSVTGQLLYLSCQSMLLSFG